MKRQTYFLQISPDHLYVTICSSAKSGETVRSGAGAELNRLLIDQGIVYGLNPTAIAKAIACIDRAEPLIEPLMVAAGTPPTPGSQGMQLQFATHPLTFEEIDENGQAHQSQLFLAPLIRPNDILAQYGPPIPSLPGKDVFAQVIPGPHLLEQVFLPGNHVVYADEKRQLVASASGYPAVNSPKKGGGSSLTLSIDKLIKVTPDRMQALLSLRPAPPDRPLPDRTTILQLLEEEGISFGRLPNTVRQCLEKTGNEQRPQQAVIALGTLPIKGKDGWLRFEMEVGPLPGKVMGNGEIDFRERNMFVGVNKGQLIAVRIPPTAGIPGKDVYGTPVPQVPGKDITIKVSDDAAYDEVTGEIRAIRSGVLSMVSEGSVKVCSRQIIAQDVDYLTGNIISRDALEIKGSIKPKFKVNALGDVVVNGDIEKAQVRSDSNVVARAGLIGDTAVIRARGDVDIKFVVHGTIFAGGSIILRQNANYCRMYSNGNLRCEPSSRIIASQLVAAGSITTGRVGSDMAEPTLLAAAVSPEQMQLYDELQRTIIAQTEAVEALRMRIGHGAESEELAELLEVLQTNEHRLARLNLMFPENQEPQDHGLSQALQCTIVVKGKVSAGTEIRIGNRHMILSVSMTNVGFSLQDPTAIGSGIPANPGIVIRTF